MTDAPWWRSTTVYQIYPRSFVDSNGDGIGDLAGILSRIDYLQSLGVEAIWLSPVYPSPQGDFGYDIADYLGVAKEYGTLDELRTLLRELHARGMKLVLDLVLNHTSDQHPWFKESRESKRSDKRDYYIWRKGARPGPPSRGGQPPNNWRSAIGPPGWQYDEGTDEWFFASFLPFQPDLNYRNPRVREEILDVVRYWLDFGIDGFRLDMIGSLFKDEAFRSNPFSPRPLPSEDDPEGFFQRPVHTINHPDTFAFMRELRNVVNQHSDPPRFMVGEVFGAASMLREYVAPDARGKEGLHMVFLFKSLRTEVSAPALRTLLEEIEREFPPPLVPTWALGNHDRVRLASRLGGDPAKQKLMAALQMTARGVPFIYYGEEVGMENLDIPLERGLDPLASRYTWVPRALLPRLKRQGVFLNRDECRTPMHWNDGLHAGFCKDDVTPWLPVHPRAAVASVALQDQQPGSMLSTYRKLLRVRRASAALSAGTLRLLGPDEGARQPLLGYERSAPNETVKVFLNVSGETQTLPPEASMSCESLTHVWPPARVGDSIKLRAYEGVLIR